MNRSIPKLVGAGVITLGLTLIPLTLPAVAQEAAPGANTVETQGDRDFDWGWLGLLGLIGLAGLRGGQRHEDTNNVGTRTTYR